MTIVRDLFTAQGAHSAPFDDHDTGDVPFVTNGYRDNGTLGYVTPLPEDRVFTEPAICVSAFCEATVPKNPFIARGNGGSGLTILTPKKPMSHTNLWAYAGYLSSRHGWKFSFGRMATRSRLEVLDLPVTPPHIPTADPDALLPCLGPPRHSGASLRFARVKLTQFFNVISGDFHSVEELEAGDIPLVSCGVQDNGIIGFYNPPKDKVYGNTLTVAYNGDYPLMAKFHPYCFAAKDDVAVLCPKEPIGLPAMLFIQILLNREVWRHSYGRKLYKARLEKFEVKVPLTAEGRVDEAAIQTWLEANPLWGDVGNSLFAGLPRLRRATLALMNASGG
jgi:hypothetical protein